MAENIHTVNIHRPGQVVRGYMDSPQRGGMVDGAEMRGTYGVMMREWAEMVMRVQTGEVSGVALHINNTVSESECEATQHVPYKPTPPAHLQTCAFVFLVSVQLPLPRDHGTHG